MSLIKIQEYLDNKGKTIEKPKELLSDKVPPAPTHPDKDKTSGKNYGFSAALNNKKLPYVAKTIKIPKTKVDDEKGLGSMGTPDVDFDKSIKNIVDFSEIKEHCGCEDKKAPFVVAYSSGAYHPDPIQAIKYIVYLTNENDNILKALMKEAQRRGCLHKYMQYLSQHPDMLGMMQQS
jgi:hypothetical protein